MGARRSGGNAWSTPGLRKMQSEVRLYLAAGVKLLCGANHLAECSSDSLSPQPRTARPEWAWGAGRQGRRAGEGHASWQGRPMLDATETAQAPECHKCLSVLGRGTKP